MLCTGSRPYPASLLYPTYCLPQKDQEPQDAGDVAGRRMYHNLFLYSWHAKTRVKEKQKM